MGKLNEGNCSICGEFGVLTYEHIPPKASNNSKQKLTQDHEQLFDSESYLYGKTKRMNKGYGKHCLCQRCNNNTGNWYAKDYVEFVRQCLENFNDPDGLYTVNEFKFTIKPLNVLKQIVAMFMCVNGDLFTEEESFRDFVLIRENQNFPSGYRVYLYTTLSKKYRYAGLSGIRMEDGEIISCSEIAHYPFGLQLTYDSNPTTEMAEITEFNQFQYNQEVSMILATPMLDVVGPHPGNTSVL